MSYLTHEATTFNFLEHKGFVLGEQADETSFTPLPIRGGSEDHVPAPVTPCVDDPWAAATGGLTAADAPF